MNIAQRTLSSPQDEFDNPQTFWKDKVLKNSNCTLSTASSFPADLFSQYFKRQNDIDFENMDIEMRLSDFKY